MSKSVVNAIAFVLFIIVGIIYLTWIKLSYDAFVFYLSLGTKNALAQGFFVVFGMIGGMTILTALMLLQIEKLKKAVSE